MTTATGIVSPTTTTSPTTSTVLTTSSSTSTTTPAGRLAVVRDVSFTSQLGLDVFAPPAGGPWPVVVLFHGGGWVGGKPEDVEPFARRLAQEGLVVFNAPYRLALAGGGYPESIEDTACAVSFARQTARTYGGDPNRLIVVGFSAGAHLGALASLAGDEFAGECMADVPALPQGFVGIAGPYDTDALGLAMLPFFQTDPENDPEPWVQGNPFHHVGKNPDLVVRLLVGSLDPLSPMSEDFGRRLEAAGYDSAFTLLRGVRHRDVLDQSETMDTVVDVAKGL